MRIDRIHMFSLTPKQIIFSRLITNFRLFDMRIAMDKKQCPIAANNPSHNLGKCYCFPMPAKLGGIRLK